MPVRETSRHFQTWIVQRLMGRGNVSRMKLRCGRKCLHGGVVAHDEIQHMRQESGIGGRATQGLGSKPAFGQERTQPLWIACDKRKRLNGNDFSHFPGVVSRLSQRICLPFRNLWSLFCKASCPSLRNVFKQVQTTSQKHGPRA